MPTKENEVKLVGTLLSGEIYDKFKKICEDMGSDTNEVIRAFIYSVVDGSISVSGG